jgi:hypothetical protein
MICTYLQVSVAHQVKEDEVGRACGTHGRGELVGKPKERHRSEDRGVESEWILGRLAGGVDSTGFGYGLMANCCKCGDKLSGYSA